MNCKGAQQLIYGYVDGELDLVRSLEVEAHLEDCSACLHLIESCRAVRSAVGAPSLRFEPPRGLERRVMTSIRKESRSTSAGSRRPTRWIPAAAALAFGALTIAALVWIGFSLARFGRAAPDGDLLAQDAISSHIRSLQASHLFDVASTDQHTVKPWFTGKLDYSPVVVDLADKGFPLVGGRLDYIDDRPVAALVYKRRLHLINLFVWPGAGVAEGSGRPRTRSLRGFHSLRWSDAGMEFCAVSDVNPADLEEFAEGIVGRQKR